MSNAADAPVVLIVEDNPDIRETLGEILDDEGFAPVGVRDGKEALDWLHSHPAPSLILLDLMMPRMSGWEFRSQQRQAPDLSQVPVIVVSGASDPAANAEALDAAAYLSKPVNVRDLLTTLRAHC